MVGGREDEKDTVHYADENWASADIVKGSLLYYGW